MRSNEPAAILGSSAVTVAPSQSAASSRSFWLLFLSSFTALYFELVVIRYLSTEVRVFAYLKNLALLACFFGIGLGMVIERPPRALKRFFPWIALVLFLLIAHASLLHLTYLPIPTFDYRMFMNSFSQPTGHWYTILLWDIGALLIYLTVVPAIMYLVVAFFAVLGGLVGENLKRIDPLQGYGVNLAGSFAGIIAFTLLSFLDSPPRRMAIAGISGAGISHLPPAAELGRFRTNCLRRRSPATEYVLVTLLPHRSDRGSASSRLVAAGGVFSRREPPFPSKDS